MHLDRPLPVFAVALAVLCLACGGGGDDDDDAGDLCATGCEATLAADCSNGPTSQTMCESDCNALRAGACATEYEALLTCSEGESVTCDAQGFPAVPGCEAEQGAFVACLNGQ